MTRRFARIVYTGSTGMQVISRLGRVSSSALKAGLNSSVIQGSLGQWIVFDVQDSQVIMR